MTRRLRYLTHMEVAIDPETPVTQWGLSAKGRARVLALAGGDRLKGTCHVVASTEVKAVQTATPLALALNCNVIYDPLLGENDRSATGYLPRVEFEKVADAFFAHPSQSVCGWETAEAAQARVHAAVLRHLEKLRGDVVFVGHGAVGTLLFCAMTGQPINRANDQIEGGGCFFEWAEGSPPQQGWQPIEGL